MRQAITLPARAHHSVGRHRISLRGPVQATHQPKKLNRT